MIRITWADIWSAYLFGIIDFIRRVDWLKLSVYMIMFAAIVLVWIIFIYGLISAIR